MADSPTAAAAAAAAAASDGAADPTATSKRHRRPSVRLGDLSPTHASAPKPHPRRPKTSNPTANLAGKRPRMMLPSTHPQRRDAARQSPKASSPRTTPKAGDFPSKARRTAGATRVRGNWTSEKGEGHAEENGLHDSDGRGNELWEEDSQSPSREQRLDVARVRVSENRDLGTVADTEEHDVMEVGNGEWGGLDEGGIRSWLDRMGLGRYSTVFEVHEVDEEVLPLLTLEDLKDMGINAVGSRRKLFCAIQKLRKGH